MDVRGDFIYHKERYTGYSIGKVILDIRTDIVEVEVRYHQDHKGSYKRILHPFKVEDGDVNVDDLMDKIYKLHF